MPGHLIFGMDYGKPITPGASRQAQADKMKEAHCTSTRDGIDLVHIWTGVGQYNWSAINPDIGVTYDEAVDISIVHGFEVIGQIATTPNWALPPGADNNYQWPPDEQYAQAFIDACAEVAAHFLGRIKYWEYWNEENANGWHTRDPAEYTKWLQRCYQGVKVGNPNAVVSIGGLDGADTGYLDDIRANGGQPYYDAVAVHPYPDPKSNPLDATGLDNLRANMEANGDENKLIWVTEYGSWKVPEDMDEATQAARIQDALGKLRFNRPWILMAAYNTIADVPFANFGLCDENLNPRQAFYRFQEMAPFVQVRAALKAP
ncbi:MAG: cellulase family glycosylhydrolase [Chloroflexi bacterium]|nr:cellulase family glycosylhydrolase [Chloroflexota bacterium]